MKAIEQALDSERDCAFILQTVAACSGAIRSLMAEILECHLRFVLTAPAVAANDRSDGNHVAAQQIQLLGSHTPWQTELYHSSACSEPRAVHREWKPVGEFSF